MLRDIFFMCAYALIFSMSAFSAEPERDPYLSFPRPYESGTFHYSFGASLTIFPRAIVEEEIRQIPLINASLRYGLSSDFSIIARFSTVYITNVVSLGGMWSIDIGNFSAAISDEFSYWFGFADFTGFDTKAMGLVNRPGISVGTDIDKYKITVKNEMLVLISQHTYFGSASVGRIKPEIAGIVTSIVLEQDLWKSTFMSFTFRANYARPNYQVWLAFSPQDRWLVFPGMEVSVMF